LTKLNRKDFYWYKLDNAAKLFPAVSTLTATNVFRITARLKVDIQPEFLQKSVELSLDEMPTFRIKLHKGMFWYYFEHNSNSPIIKEEYAYPCKKIDRYTNNAFLFEVTYFEKNINCEVFHALSDGTGALKFLARIVEHYLILSHSDINYKIPKDIVIASDIAQSEDSFVRITNDGIGESESIVRAPSYPIESILTNDNEIKVIKGIMPIAKVKALAKEKGVSLTVFLCAVLINSIYLESFKFNPKNQSIDICVPVNLRNYFPSETFRNFFTSIAVGVNFYKKNYSFDEIISLTSIKFKEQLNEDALYSKVKYGVEMQNKIFLRCLPLFLKNVGLKYAFSKGEKGYSAVLSNLGCVKLPSEIACYVDRFEFMLSPTRNNHYKTSVCSFEDKLVYCFTTNVENTDIQKRFFSILIENGIDVIISCNEYSPNTESEDNDKNEQV